MPRLPALPGPALGSVELLSEEVLLAVPPSHHLARRTHAEVSALALAKPFVTTRPGYWQRALTDQLFADAGAEPVIVCEGDEPYAIRGLISAGVGIGLMPAMARQSLPPELLSVNHWTLLTVGAPSASSGAPTPTCQQRPPSPNSPSAISAPGAASPKPVRRGEAMALTIGRREREQERETVPVRPQ